MNDIEKIQQDIKLAIKNDSHNQLKFVAELAAKKFDELKNVIAERDAAIAEIEEILTAVERIRLRAEDALPRDIDDALGIFCLYHCANDGRRCFKEGNSPGACENWKWRGVSDDPKKECPKCQHFMTCEPPKQAYFAMTKVHCQEFTPKTKPEK